MLRTMTAYELAEWHEFWNREPFGPKHEDYRTAMVAQLLYDINRDHDKSKSLSIDEFTPKYADGLTAERQRREKARALADNLAKIKGVKVTKKKRKR